MLGAGEVRDPNPGRVGLAARAPHGDDALALASAMRDQPCLGAVAVDTVNDVVVLAGKTGGQVVDRDEFLDGIDRAVGIDLPDTFPHHLYLGHAQGGGQGMQLAIDIRLGYVVEVDQRQLSDGRACQCLGRPRADPADTQHADMGAAKAHQCRLSIEARDTAEAPFGIGGRYRTFVRGLGHVRNIPENVWATMRAIAYNAGMELIDTHCHLDVEEFAADRAAVLARARANGVAAIVVPGVLARTWPALLDFCASAQDLYPALGMHPVYLDQHRKEDVRELERAVAAQPVLAIGEIGLDFYLAGLDPARQQSLFEAQLEIARSCGLPVILHVRKAHDAVLATLRRIRVAGGICHAFNGSLQQAAIYRELGFRLGFGGMLTFERSRKLRVLAQSLPLDDIVLETDAPDMTVAQHRGERNSPEYLPFCLAALAQLRELPEHTVAEQTTANARAVLRLDRGLH